MFAKPINHLAILALAGMLSLALTSPTVRAEDPPGAPASTGQDAAGHVEDAHGEHGDAHGEPDPIKSGGLANAIATLITFGLLLFILGRFVWPVVLKALKDREDFIRDSLSSAKKEREEAERLLADYKTQLEQARQEATAIVDEGRRDSEVVRRQILDDARAESDATLKRAKREIELARDTAVKDLYTLSGDLATELAGKILQKELDASTHERLIQESIQQLAGRSDGNGNSN